MTVNELLTLMTAVRSRLAGLAKLRSEVSTKDTFMYGGDDKKIIEPQYDVKAVDKKITELQTFLYKADAKIKASNAKTEVDIVVDVDSLLQPLQ